MALVYSECLSCLGGRKRIGWRRCSVAIAKAASGLPEKPGSGGSPEPEVTPAGDPEEMGRFQAILGKAAASLSEVVSWIAGGIEIYMLKSSKEHYARPSLRPALVFTFSGLRAASFLLTFPFHTN